MSTTITTLASTDRLQQLTDEHKKQEQRMTDIMAGRVQGSHVAQMYREERAECDLVQEQCRRKLESSSPDTWIRIAKGMQFMESKVKLWTTCPTNTNATLLVIETDDNETTSRHIHFATHKDGQYVFVTGTNKIYNCAPECYDGTGKGAPDVAWLQQMCKRPVYMEYRRDAEEEDQVAAKIKQAACQN